MPTVSCLITTYNYARFLPRAIESALAQDYRLGELDIVIVDDGSTDDTPAVVAPYRDRVRYVRKENGGLVSAVNRGLEECTGDLIALLDADDEWPPDKLSRQVVLLEEHPEVGLVHGDMAVIDVDGRVVADSFFASHNLKPLRGRPVGALSARNFVTTAALVVRASLREHFHPIPSWSPWADWWITRRVAEVADIDHLPEVVARYRRHGDNAALGVAGEQLARALGRELELRRWMLVNADPSLMTAEEALQALAAFDWTLTNANSAPPVDGTQREAAAAALARTAEAETGGDLDAAVFAAVAALGHAPDDSEARATLARLLSSGARSRPKQKGTTAPDAPAVSIVVTAYNLARFLPAALDSALAQDYPSDALQIVVVDDGSTDDTRSVLAAYADRVEIVSQENRGLIGATNAGLERARGDYITFLDADDVWPRDRVRRLVAALEHSPDAGLAYGDMEMIDADGRLIHGSYLDSHRVERVSGRVIGPLLRQSLIAAGSLMVRAEHYDRFFPIAPWAPYQDWWIAHAVAQVAEVVHVRAPVNRYRLHGKNDFLAQSGDRLARALREEIPFRRRMLTRLAAGAARPAEVVACIDALDVTMRNLAQLTAEHPEVSGGDRERAGEAHCQADAALAAGDVEKAIALLANAVGHDPRHAGVREALASFAAGLRSLDETRSLTALTLADELVADPELARAWAERFGPDADATLVLYAPGVAPDDAVATLSPALAAAGAEESDMLLVTDAADAWREAALASRCRALVTRQAAAGPLAALEKLAPEALPSLP